MGETIKNAKLDYKQECTQAILQKLLDTCSLNMTIFSFFLVFSFSFWLLLQQDSKTECRITRLVNESIGFYLRSSKFNLINLVKSKIYLLPAHCAITYKKNLVIDIFPHNVDARLTAGLI